MGSVIFCQRFRGHVRAVLVSTAGVIFVHNKIKFYIHYIYEFPSKVMFFRFLYTFQQNLSAAFTVVSKAHFPKVNLPVNVKLQVAFFSI